MTSTARIATVLGAALLLAACGSTQYIMSTKEGRLIVSDGKPQFDEKTGNYTYKDSEGRKATIQKADIVQVMER
jgi:major membrane immunogen (membrane-anchored lipoprotein)